MTQVYDEAGRLVPVTVIEAGPCRVAQIKTRERDGYEAVQLAFGEVPERKLSKAEAGHLKATQVPMQHGSACPRSVPDIARPLRLPSTPSRQIARRSGGGVADPRLPQN